MRIPPDYKITSEMLELIAKIDANRFFLRSYPIPHKVKKNLHRKSLLKSSLFSAKIEGNELTLENINSSSKQREKQEVANILNTISYVDKEIISGQNISIEIILQLHELTLKGLSPEAGRLRKEFSAIFNQAGIAVYTPPPPGEINKLINDLLGFINRSGEKFPLVLAFVTHLVYEKIHPFLDGNGRVGRLLVFLIMKIRNYDFGIFIPFEERLNERKDDYYYFLDIGLKQPERYLLFMLKIFFEQTEDIKKEVLNYNNDKKILLPPRQDELLQIIKDHRVVSFDFLCRRFLQVPKRTLRYDVKKLCDQKLITKIGKTKGSYYRVTDN